MTNPEDKELSGKGIALGCAPLLMMFLMFECWHQFRDSSGFEAALWLMLLVGGWVASSMALKAFKKEIS